MNGLSFRNIWSENFRINTYEKVQLVGLAVQLIAMHGLYNIKFILLTLLLRQILMESESRNSYGRKYLHVDVV